METSIQVINLNGLAYCLRAGQVRFKSDPILFRVYSILRCTSFIRKFTKVVQKVYQSCSKAFKSESHSIQSPQCSKMYRLH